MANEYDAMRAREKPLAELRIKIQTDAVKNEYWQTCMNCDSFSESMRGNRHRNMDMHPPGFCTLFKAHPPAAVIVTGCDSWCMDIPF